MIKKLGYNLANIIFWAIFREKNSIMERVITEGYTNAESSPIVRMSTTELKAILDEIVKKVSLGEERVILSQDGKDVAAVISIEEFWFLEKVIEELEDKIDLEESRMALAEAKEALPYRWG